MNKELDLSEWGRYLASLRWENHTPDTPEEKRIKNNKYAKSYYHAIVKPRREEQKQKQRNNK
jgi:hypothetical protein